MNPRPTIDEASIAGFSDLLSARAEEVGRHMVRLAASLEVGPPMREIIDYALAAPGKRVRGVIVLWANELFVERANGDAIAAAVALEWVHTYSLIHDDLPAMDDDDFRRGRATCHKVYGEAMAILAGDALLTAAFELLAREVVDSRLALGLIRELASAAGAAGMIAGQAADMHGEGELPSAEQLNYIHRNKTAKLFRCAALMGGICGGARADQLAVLAEYGLNLGLGFQISDDILDISASTETLGKTAGKDARAGKATYPALFGMEQARAHARNAAYRAIEQIDAFGPQANCLRQLGLALVDRKS